MKIVEDKNYKKLSTFWKENGLEIEVLEKAPEEVIKAWSITAEDGQLIAAAAIEHRDNSFVIADLAVAPEFRGQNHAKALMELAEREILNAGGRDAWLVGKVPGFYAKLGWEIRSRDEAPDISKCLTCEDFQVSCHPQIMYKMIANI